jgi:cellulose synthase/poly-beta-1,6-N-acetylglucosamine synthase-like glycosyltransferase/peptidoglycan/xylan/chitin deacetylase (PgdA/CDA1 family)
VARVALTFDDGPGEWTEAILDVLSGHGAQATFFVIGRAAERHPDLIRRMDAEGHEIGNHTWSHQQLTGQPGWQQTLQLDLTGRAVVAADGVTPRLYRPPYSGTPAGLDASDLESIAAAGRRGLVAVLTDHDSRDWARPGAEAVADAALPPDANGGIVLFHDGGGDRAETVAALRLVIERARARGLRFATVSAATGMDPAATAPAASAPASLQATSVVVAYRVGQLLVFAGTWLLPAIGLLVIARAVVLAHASRRHAQLMRATAVLPYGPGVSVIVPAYNEAVGIERCVRSLLDTDHRGPVEVVVVDDGSTDGTAAIVHRLLRPGLGLRLLRQPNGGKASALNTGVAAARHDIVVCVDGDTIFERDTIRWLVHRFIDPEIGAVSGNTKVANRRGFFGRGQHVEYVMGFNLERRAYELWDCMPTVPGAIGAFRRSAWEAVGGASTDTLAEDTDLTMAVNRAGWRVVYEDRAVAWTEAPATARALWRQRYRWCYGTMQAMWKHRAVVTARPASPLGRRAIPNLVVFGVVFPVLAPLVDVFALYGLVFLDRRAVLLAWVLFAAAGLAVGAYAFHLDGERPTALWILPLQQFVYRQLMYLVVIRSITTALAGSRLGWQKLERTGDFSAADRA